MYFKRTASILCAAVMALAAAGLVRAESAAPGGVSEVYSALSRLMLETDNVTLEMTADFSYDGVPFKTLRGRLVQDGYDRVIEADFSTLRPNGSSYDTSWKVHSIGGEVHFYNSYDGEYYSSTWADASDSVLNLDESDALLVRLAGSAMDLVDLAAPSLSSAVETENGREIVLSLSRDTAPEYLNWLCGLMIQKAAQRYMFVSLGLADTEGIDDEDSVGAEVWHEDDWELYKRLLSDAAGREMTDSECEELVYSEDPLVNEAYTALWKLEKEAVGDHDSGYVYIRSDKSSAWYPTLEDMGRAEGLRWVEFEDEDASFIRYMKETCGETVTADDLAAIWYSDNAELWDAYLELTAQMKQSYLDKLDGHLLGYVSADGEIRFVDDLDAYYSLMDVESEKSIAYSALTSMRQVKIGDSVLKVLFDREGRITQAEGRICLDFIQADGSVHPVVIDLKASASAYGESAVGEFDPEAWGLVSFLEYYAPSEGAEEETDSPEEPEYPETVTLNGVAYPVTGN